MLARRFVGLLVTIAVAGMSLSAATVKPGDLAPKTLPSKWVQGEPVREFQKGKAYLVEFWATWCGTCVQMIPHVNALEQKFKDKGLVIIAVNAGESEAKTKLFLKQMGTNMTYRVGLDVAGEVANAWFDLSSEKLLLPASFLIDKNGKVLFSGLPVELDDSIIQQTLDGTMTAEKMAAIQEAAKQKIEKFQKFAAQFEEGMQRKEWDKASSALDELEKLMADNKREAAAVQFQRLRLLINRGDAKVASAFATKTAEGYKDDASLLNAIAWLLITEPGITERDLALAEKLCKQANTLLKHPQLLDTLARILFMAGKKNDAIEAQTQAVALADGQLKEALQKNLTSYKEGKLPATE